MIYIIKARQKGMSLPASPACREDYKWFRSHQDHRSRQDHRSHQDHQSHQSEHRCLPDAADHCLVGEYAGGTWLSESGLE